MKRKVRVAILGAMLHGTVHAAVQNTPVEPSLNKGQDKVADAKGAPPSSKDKVARGKKKRPAVKAAEAATPEAQKQGGAVGNSTDASEQTVQLRGVRG